MRPAVTASTAAAVITSATNDASPPSTVPGAVKSSWKLGFVDHGAPVWRACVSSVGSHGA